MSSGFMVGSHEARLAHVPSGHWHTREPWTSVLYFFFPIKFNILVGLMSNSPKQQKEISKKLDLGIMRRKVCCEPHFKHRKDVQPG